MDCAGPTGIDGSVLDTGSERCGRDACIVCSAGVDNDVTDA